MKLFRLTLFAVTSLLSTSLLAQGPEVEIETNLGKITVELNVEKAPLTVANFLSYVKDGSYNNSMFHRVIPRFVAQGGGYDASYHPLPVHAPVQNESNNGLSNKRGSIAMARMSEPDSATRQFYFNLKDNQALDAHDDQAGYTVFGSVVSGMDVLDKIAKEPTMVDPHLRTGDVPTTPIIIHKMTLLPDAAPVGQQPLQPAAVPKS